MRLYNETINVMFVVAVFVIVFFGDFFSAYGFVSPLLPDVLIAGLLLLLFTKAVLRNRVSRHKFLMPGLLPVVVSLSFYILSAIINDTGLLITIVFVRSVLEYYILFLAILNLNFEEKSFRKMNTLLLVFCVIQIPVALIKLYLFGQDSIMTGGTDSFGAEIAAGTFGRASGAMGTTFPLIVIGFLFAFYLYQHKKSYLFLIAGFILFSFLTGKRAFPLVFPFFILLLYWLISSRQWSGQLAFKRLMLAGFIGVVGLFLGITLHPSLNPSSKIGGRFNIKHTFFYALEYESSETGDGEAMGRISSTISIIDKYANEGILCFLFGKGPGTFAKSGLVENTFRERFKELDIIYGFTGFVWCFAQS